MSDIDKVAELNSWFSYCPETGLISWKKKPNRNIRIGATAGFLWKDGRSRKTNYIRVCLHGKCIFAHTLAFVCFYGRFPKGDIDHINGDATDNRITNLRDVTHTQNLRNQKRSVSNKSGVMGVDFHSAAGKWRARIIVDKSEHHLGTYSDFFDAVCARKSAERAFGFHLNHGREA
jgi:hypothetical protein